MKIIKSPGKIYLQVQKWRKKGEKVGFVPTMGALHNGHLALIRRARRENDRVVVSIFVNPIQFGPEEDYQHYPRPFRKDIALCRQEKVDVVFAPGVKQMYPDKQLTRISVAELEDLWCGKFRPGHFQGVATVVAKLFNIVFPDVAYFGEKDFQQLVIVRKLASDLNFPIKIIPVKTVRERTGLAMSSRNTYLSLLEHQAAEKIYPALKLLRKKILLQEIKPESVYLEFDDFLKTFPEFQKIHWKLEYAAVVREDNLQPITDYQELLRANFSARVLVALWIGRTRLIDNIRLK